MSVWRRQSTMRCHDNGLGAVGMGCVDCRDYHGNLINGSWWPGGVVWDYKDSLGTSESERGLGDLRRESLSEGYGY